MLERKLSIMQSNFAAGLESYHLTSFKPVRDISLCSSVPRRLSFFYGYHHKEVVRGIILLPYPFFARLNHKKNLYGVL
jgi:hypothetical protein